MRCTRCMSRSTASNTRNGPAISPIRRSPAPTEGMDNLPLWRTTGNWHRARSSITCTLSPISRAAALAVRPIAPLGPRQPDVLAQRHASIISTEQAAPLQLGHHEAHEVLIGARDVSSGEHKAIACVGREPLLQPVRDLVRGADKERQL